MKEKNIASISNQELVADGKSRRLKAIRNKTMQKKWVINTVCHSRQNLLEQLKPAEKAPFYQALELIEQKLNSILQDYPPAKKNTFFRIKHGVELIQVKQMAIKECFELLHLQSSQIPHFHLIENLNTYGVTVESEIE